MDKGFLLIDLDDTLLDFSKSENVAIKLALSSFGVRATEEEAALYKQINIDVWKEFEKGYVTREVLGPLRFQRLIEKIDLSSVTDRELNLKYCELLARQHFMIEGAEEFLKKIAPYFHIIGVSNGTSKVQWQRIKDSGLDKLCETIFISEDIGYQKPTRAYFEYVAAHVPSFDKSRAVIVGDSLSSDIAGGKNYGIITIWYAPRKKEDGVADYAVRDYKELFDILLNIYDNFNV